jgi:hypothetical protein
VNREFKKISTHSNKKSEKNSQKWQWKFIKMSFKIDGKKEKKITQKIGNLREKNRAVQHSKKP